MKYDKKPNEITTFAEYQLAQQRTADLSAPLQNRILNAALGLAGEAGESIDILKKHIFHQHDLDFDSLAYEIGDVLWYLSELASALGIHLEDIANRNIEKLYRRYPNGFDPLRSQERSE